jgi:hypothetical protein
MAGSVDPHKVVAISTPCTLEKNIFSNVKKVQIQGSICFKLVPGLLVNEALSKVTLNTAKAI